RPPSPSDSLPRIRGERRLVEGPSAIQRTVPRAREADALVQAHLRGVAELLARFVDGMPIAGAEDVHAEPGQEGLALRACDRRKPLECVARGVERAVGNM